MTINQTLAETLRRRQIYLMRHQASFRAAIDQYLTLLDQGIAASIIDISPNEPARDAYRAQRVDKLIDEVSVAITATYKNIKGFSVKELSGLAEVESLFLLNQINTLLSRKLENIALSPADATALVKDTLLSGAVLADWWDGQAEALRTRFSQEMRIGMLNGESDADLIRRVRGTKALGYMDGIIGVSRRKARILVRGAASSVVNATRQKAVADNPAIFSGVQQISVLDGRTSQVCIAYAGKCWATPGYKPIGHSLPYNGGVPRHPNCRSTIIPIVVDSLGGAPADDVTFDEFIKDKSAADLDELLGKGKAQLYREGKITFSDLVDQSGRPMTLEELKQN